MALTIPQSRILARIINAPTMRVVADRDRRQLIEEIDSTGRLPAVGTFERRLVDDCALEAGIILADWARQTPPR
jgi:hypothetical protein